MHADRDGRWRRWRDGTIRSRQSEESIVPKGEKSQVVAKPGEDHLERAATTAKDFVPVIFISIALQNDFQAPVTVYVRYVDRGPFGYPGHVCIGFLERDF